MVDTASLAGRTFMAILNGRAGAWSPIPVPLDFWSYRETYEDSAGGGCSSGNPYSLTIYGPLAGTVRGEHPDAPDGGGCRVDGMARADFRGHVERLIADGYTPVSGHEDPDRMLWIGQRPGLADRGIVTATVQMRRGPVRADNPQVAELAALLRGHRPDPSRIPA